MLLNPLKSIVFYLLQLLDRLITKCLKVIDKPIFSIINGTLIWKINRHTMVFDILLPELSVQAANRLQP